MNDREKLADMMIELKGYLEEIYEFPTLDYFLKELAMQLVANGVTFATGNNDGCKWIPVTERLPGIKKMIDGEEYMKTVAVRIEGCEVEKIAYYDDEENRWFDTDDFPIFEKVTHWYELPEWNLPQPPKGE